VGCPHLICLHSPVATSPFTNEKRLHYCEPREKECEKLPVSSTAVHQLSLASCGGTPLLEAAISTTERRWLSGRPNSLPNDQKLPRWLPMKHSNVTFKNDWLVRYVTPMGPFASDHHRDPGMDAINDASIKIANGFRDGVLSKSHKESGLIFPMTHR